MITVSNAFKDFHLSGLSILPTDLIIELLQYGVLSGNPCWAESYGTMDKVRDLLYDHPELKTDEQIKNLLRCFNLKISDDNRLKKYDYGDSDADRTILCDNLGMSINDFKKYNFSAPFNTRCEKAIEIIKKYL